MVSLEPRRRELQAHRRDRRRPALQQRGQAPSPYRGGNRHSGSCVTAPRGDPSPRKRVARAWTALPRRTPRAASGRQ
jgi:hypothetical protein